MTAKPSVNVFCRNCNVSSPRELFELARPSRLSCLICGEPIKSDVVRAADGPPVWLWTWAGECFGYREGDNLWTHDGKHAGKFHGGDEVYDSHGRYVGEVADIHRLIADSAKNWKWMPSFMPLAKRIPREFHASRPPLPMCDDHKDFPSPNCF